jgi:hypothetical protein
VDSPLDSVSDGIAGSRRSRGHDVTVDVEVATQFVHLEAIFEKRGFAISRSAG